MSWKRIAGPVLTLNSLIIALIAASIAVHTPLPGLMAWDWAAPPRRSPSSVPSDGSPLAAMHKVSAELIQPESDLEYLGAFRLPATVEGVGEQCNKGYSGSYGWSYGGSGATYYPYGDPQGPDDGFPGSLFGVGHPYEGCVSEVTIPEPVISPDKELDDLPTAGTLQPFTDVTAGRQTGGLTGTVLGDIQYYPRQGAQTTDKLYWVMYEYYLPEPDAAWHGWCELDFSNLQSQGTWRLDDFPASATSRYLFDIPQSWADAYTPGKYLAAGRNRLVNDGSWGPALYAFGPWNDGNPPPDGSAVDAVQLLKYDSDHTLRDYSHSDEWSDGAWLTVGNKSAVIFAGTKALRTSASGLEYYGEPDVDGCGYKGYHGEPYYGAILFYDPMLLAEVAKGTIEPHEVQPYAVFNVEDYTFRQGCRRSILGGIAYDRQRNLLYVMERLVDGFYDRRPIVHVFRVMDSGQEPDLEPPTTPQNLRADNVTSEQVELSWDASSDNVHLVGYIIYRDGEPIATTVITSYTDTRVNPSAVYSYTVVAWDARSNRSAPSEPLVVTTRDGPDSREPIISNVRVRDITEGSAVVTWHTDELATTCITYGVQYSGSETTIEDPTLTTMHRVTLTGLAANTTYVFHIASTDAAGNTHEYPARAFTTSPPGGTGGFAPILNGIGSRRVYEGERLRFTVTADDQDGDVLVYSADPLPPGASFDTQTGQFTWTPGFDDAGTYSVTFTVSDGTWSDSELVTIFVLDTPTCSLYLPLVLKGP